MNVTICLLLFCLCAMGDHSAASIVESNKYTQQSFDPLVMLYFRMYGEFV